MMPATHAIVDNAKGDVKASNGYTFPPCIIIERGESLEQWAKREVDRDFVTTLQARAACACCSLFPRRNCTFDVVTTLQARARCCSCLSHFSSSFWRCLSRYLRIVRGHWLGMSLLSRWEHRGGALAQCVTCAVQRLTRARRCRCCTTSRRGCRCCTRRAGRTSTSSTRSPPAAAALLYGLSAPSWLYQICNYNGPVYLRTCYHLQMQAWPEADEAEELPSP
jgi:hypothetical protein